jgi:undecaprenyl diphosphate synthase
MILFDSFLDESIEKIKSKNVKIRFIGDFSKFDKNIQDKINRLSLLSENNKGLTLTLAVNYGGRSDIVNAVNKLVCDKKSNKVDEKKFSKYIMNSDVPNPDLLIRTGSEKRLSNFLLWDLAYTELLFLNEMWPEFDMKLLKYSIKEFKKRIRNYGGNYV